MTPDRGTEPGVVPVGGFSTRTATRSDEERLREQIGWFNRMRGAAAVVGYGLCLLSHAAGWVENVVPLYVLSGLAFIVNCSFLRWSREHRDLGVEPLRRHVDLQIAVDLAILTGLLHFSGGVSNPLVLLILFHTFIAAFLLSVRAAVVTASGSFALILLLGFGERSSLLSHHHLAVGLFDVTAVSSYTLCSWVGSLGLILGLSIYFASRMVMQLKRRDEAVAGLRQQLALSEKLASIGTLAAGVSHEINNPVGVIRTKAKVLRYRIADGDPSDVLLAEVDTIERHTKRIAAITDGLLAFSRETPFELLPTDLNALVEEAGTLVRVPFQTAEIGLDARASRDLPPVLGSANHLLQVLINILLNAKDASTPGSHVELETGTRDGEPFVRISDHGSGIPEELLGKIFDPFFTTKDVDRGTGLGLALSHGIVERHGGRIEVESSVGRGTVFTVVLRPIEGTARNT
jgi:signal transduction histidine kinase